MDKTTTGAQHPSATVRHLREMAAARVESTSLRGVAREIGMSPTGLKKFLMGTAPYSPTVRRLRRWYLQYAALPAAEITYHHADSALVVLTHDLSPEPKREASGCVLECLARAYEASGRAQPAWIGELRAQHGPRPRR
jgi:AcrR family transcriptional regulator